ncbi:radical SAM protein [Candidatus Pelagibacter sp. HIMB1587]|uniref:radical SAM protein n=1 Tax=Candidatus Pelagibacter sp. HIMB1587 TaxID=3413354 RepID=UPI003F83A62F
MELNKKKELEKKYNFKSNYIKHIGNFRNEIIQKKIIPYQVEFQAPPRGKKICWLECPYCYGLSADNNGERLSKERGLEILRQILDGGVKKIIFAGYATDPLNCSYIGELLDLTISKKAIFGFNTKALKISETFFNALEKNKISDGSYISLSVDSGSNETYNLIHDVKAKKAKIYDQVLNNARRLGDLKKKNYFDLSAAYLVNANSANLNDYENFINDFISAGCNVLRFSFPQPPKDTTTAKGVVPTPEEINLYLSDLNKLKKKYEKDNCLIIITNPDSDHDIYNKPRTIPCYARYLFPTVGFDGWLYNCSQSSAPNFRSTALGDLTKNDFWKLFYNYDNENLDNYIKVCSKKISDSGCRCDRKEHIVNQFVIDSKVF